MGPREPNPDDFYPWDPFGEEMAYADDPPRDNFTHAAADRVRLLASNLISLPTHPQNGSDSGGGTFVVCCYPHALFGLWWR